MPISFSCPQCGRSLKAPDQAAGKSSKCPGCGSPVTCPEAIYDAELLSVTPDEPDQHAGVGSEQMYAMEAEAVPVAAAAPEVEFRRPCPMCGEMIIATAAKCRFCGEIFDATIAKAGMGGNKGELKSVASAQRNMLVCVLLFLGCFVGSGVIQGMDPKASDPALGLVRVIIGAIYLAATIGLMIYIFMLARKMYNLGIGILLGLLAIVPCVNFLLAFMVNQRVTKYLQEHGYEVGFLGAKVS
jgi:predicted RNA-binding Zn-ribbon protein involved in translation (DUF1610 family)